MMATIGRAALIAAATLSVAAGGVVAARPHAASAGQTTGDNPGGAATGVDASSGAQVYQEICQGCHMPHAEGGQGAGAIPALARNPHLADPDFVVTTLLRGRGGMPAFDGMLEPAQIAGVASYVRSHFGNDYHPPITAEQVKRAAASSPSPGM